MIDERPIVTAPDSTAPDYVAPLEAWRVWRVVEREGELVLASVVNRTLWPPGRVLEAVCLQGRGFFDWVRRRPPHAAPEPWCGCGVYGADLTRAGEYLVDVLPNARARVLGRVALWGTVVECEHGFRASHAYPLALYVAADASSDRTLGTDELASRLARYSVPIELLPASRRELPALLAGSR